MRVVKVIVGDKADNAADVLRVAPAKRESSESPGDHRGGGGGVTGLGPGVPLNALRAWMHGPGVPMQCAVCGRGDPPPTESGGGNAPGPGLPAAAGPGRVAASSVRGRLYRAFLAPGRRLRLMRPRDAPRPRPRFPPVDSDQPEMTDGDPLRGRDTPGPPRPPCPVPAGGSGDVTSQVTVAAVIGASESRVPGLGT